MDELKALDIIRKALEPKVYDKRTNECKAYAELEALVKKHYIPAPDELDKIIEEVMNAETGWMADYRADEDNTEDDRTLADRLHDWLHISLHSKTNQEHQEDDET